MIKCNFISKDNRDMEINADGRLWPCCKYTTELTKQNGILDADEYLQQLNHTDPNWNNVLVYPIDKILEHNFFTTYVNVTGWNSENPPPLCLHKCSKNKFFNNYKKTV